MSEWKDPPAHQRFNWTLVTKNRLVPIHSDSQQSHLFSELKESTVATRMAGKLLLFYTVVILLVFQLEPCSLQPTDPCTTKQVTVQAVDKAGVGSKVTKLYVESVKGLVTKTVPAGGALELVAVGPEPLEWSYEGPGEPFEAKIIREKTSEGCYLSRFRQTGSNLLQAENTGLYKANSAGHSISTYVYFPNEYPPFLLNTARVQTVYLQPGSPLLLPCLQNNPSVHVSFAKRIGLNEWRDVDRPQEYNYNGRNGFTIRKPVQGSKSLYGSYKCFTDLRNRNDTAFFYVTESE